MILARISSLSSVSLSNQGRNFLSFKTQPVLARRLWVLCAVEIVMGLEEEFGTCIEEESAQSIATVQDATDFIEKLVEKKDH